MNLHEVFNVAYSDLSESVKCDILKSIAEKVDINEEFICESGELSPMVDFVNTISHSDVSEEELNEILDLSFESFSGEEVEKVTEEFINLSAREALFSVMEDVDPAKRAEAAKNSIPGRTQKALDANISTKRLIKGSDENKKLNVATQRLKAAQGLVKPTAAPTNKTTAMSKLKGVANKVLGAFKGLGKSKAPAATNNAAKAKSWSNQAAFFDKIGRKTQANFARSQAAKYQGQSTGSTSAPTSTSAQSSPNKEENKPKMVKRTGRPIGLAQIVGYRNPLPDGTKKEEAPKSEPKAEPKAEGPKSSEPAKPAPIKPIKQVKSEPKAEPKEEAPKVEPAKEEKPVTKKGKAKKATSEPNGQLKLDLGTKEGKKKAIKKVKETTEKVAKTVKAPKNIKIDVPKTEETSKDAKEEKKELAKEYTKETSKAKPNEEKVKEIVNKTKEAENKEGFLKQEEKKKAKGEKGTIKISSKIKAHKEAKKEEAPEVQEPVKAEETPKAEVKPAKVEAPKKETKPKAQTKLKIEPKKEAKVEAPKKEAKVESKAEGTSTKGQNAVEKPKLSDEEKEEKIRRNRAIINDTADARHHADGIKANRKIIADLENKAKTERLTSQESKRLDDTKKNLKSSEGLLRSILNRSEMKQEDKDKFLKDSNLVADNNAKGDETKTSTEIPKSKYTDEERKGFEEKIKKHEATIKEYSKKHTPQADAQIRTLRKYIDAYNKKLNESLVEALDLLEANLSEESFFEILEMMVTEPKSKADRFKEMMAEKHII